MSNKAKLNPAVVQFLSSNLGTAKVTIQSEISRLKREFPDATLNAVAQVYAKKKYLSILRLIGKEDKLTIPSNIKYENIKVVKVKKKTNSKEKIKEIIQFDTKDIFLKKHIAEINRSYSRKCYTCVFILTRKVFENYRRTLR